MSPKRQKATITDVANHAGVSVATVSRVFNHKGIVNEDTYRQVMESAQALNYQKSSAAPAPIPADSRRSEKDLLIINIPSLSNPFYNEIVKGAKAAAELHDYDLLLNQGHINEGNLSSIMHMLSRVNAKGIITLNHLTAEVVQTLSASFPLVQCCEFEEYSPVSTVGIDDLLSSKNAMDYILSTGHRKIALVNGPIEYKYARHRREGYLKALENAGIEVNPDWIIQLPEINADMAFSSVAKLLTMPNPPDAFFAVSDLCAAAVIRATKHTNFRVPEDIIVVGFDNVDISSITMPSITTVNQPKFQLGYISCELMHEKLTNPSAETKHMVLNTELIIRESTAIPVMRG
ncbi:LacI family DNA-binding transcriptional regulator [Diplocloster hominis]|uniref:LacI family DNA-binding transcriptional regulator n=1 Tax=Diplocloster hominis TaxID=3079010 RepID=UPI0031BB5E7C